MLEEIRKLTKAKQSQFKAGINHFLRTAMKPKTRMPESDWERMEIDQIKEKPNQKFREPKRKPKQERKLKCRM